MDVVTLTVSMPPKAVRFIEAAVRGGKYPAADALIADAVQGLRSGTRVDPPSTPTPAALGSGEVNDLTQVGFDGPASMAGLGDKFKR